MSSKPTEVIAVILHHHVQAGHEEQVLHHGSGKPVLVIGDRESFVNINSMDTACARGAAAAAEHLWQAGCRRFFVLGAPHPDEQNTKRNGNGNGFGPRRLTAIPQRRASSNRENPRPFRSLVRKRVGKAAPALLQSGKVACRHPYAWPESAQTACGMTAPPCPRNSGYSWSERVPIGHRNYDGRIRPR